MKQQLLMLEDVDGLGKKGEVVTAKPGYVRNFLLPKRLAIVASANTLRKQQSLREERAKQAVVDRKESEELAMLIERASPIETRVKVDPEGHMYGSVSASDIATLFQQQGLPIDRKNVLLPRPIKATGAHKIALKLKEGVAAACTLNIIAEGVAAVGIEAVTAPIPPAEGTEAPPEAENPSV